MKKKVLLVTGASSDVGGGLIREVANKYEYIWAHYCQSEFIVGKLQEELGDKVLPVQADFTEEESVAHMIATIKESDKMPDHIVHFPASSNMLERFEKQGWQDFNLQIKTSLQSIVLILEAFIPYMKKEKCGKIIFMLSSSILGKPPAFQSSYITTKYALLGLMKSLAVEYADKGIQVNGVSPDMMETKYIDELPSLVRQKSAEENPMKRNLMVDDVVPTFAYLLSEGTEAITGQNIGITGGVR